MPHMNKLSRYRTIVTGTPKGGDLTVRYASTDILVMTDPCHARLTTGGWRTVTTKRKLNQAASEFSLELSIWQKNREWFVRDRTGTVHEFYDGIVIPV